MGVALNLKSEANQKCLKPAFVLLSSRGRLVYLQNNFLLIDHRNWTVAHRSLASNSSLMSLCARSQISGHTE